MAQRRIIVVGHGPAGLCAALSALETAAEEEIDVRVTALERAPATAYGDGPIRGLYAAGEITGHFHGTAPNAVAMLRALAFGRIAGRNAVRSV